MNALYDLVMYLWEMSNNGMDYIISLLLRDDEEDTPDDDDVQEDIFDEDVGNSNVVSDDDAVHGDTSAEADPLLDRPHGATDDADVQEDGVDDHVGGSETQEAPQDPPQETQQPKVACDGSETNEETSGEGSSSSEHDDQYTGATKPAHSGFFAWMVGAPAMVQS